MLLAILTEVLPNQAIRYARVCMPLNTVSVDWYNEYKRTYLPVSGRTKLET